MPANKRASTKRYTKGQNPTKKRKGFKLLQLAAQLGKLSEPLRKDELRAATALVEAYLLDLFTRALTLLEPNAPPPRIDRHTSPRKLGLDPLIAVEVRN